eukprot:g124.t1
MNQVTRASSGLSMDKKNKDDVDATEELISSDSVASVITNLGVTAALLASIALSVILTVSREEIVAGDIIRLSQKNPAFRHHFSPNTTLNMCFGNYKKNADTYRPQDRVDKHENQGLNQYYWNKCKGENMLESSRIATLVTPEKYVEWLYTDTDGKANFWHVSTWDMPSKLLARDGFITCVLLLAAVFMSLVLLISLEFSGARTSSKHFKEWIKIGFFQIIVVYVMLVAACVEFIISMAAIIMIRFPMLGHSTMWEWEVNSGFWLVVTMSSLLSLVQLICTVSRSKPMNCRCKRKVKNFDT